MPELYFANIGDEENLQEQYFANSYHGISDISQIWIREILFLSRYSTWCTCCTTLGWTKKTKLFTEMNRHFWKKRLYWKARVNPSYSKANEEERIKKGKAHKSRIYKKVIFQKHKTLLIANFYEALLPMFKSFILIFEQKTTQVHKLHLKLAEVTRDFFV